MVSHLAVLSGRRWNTAAYAGKGASPGLCREGTEEHPRQGGEGVLSVTIFDDEVSS